MRRVLKSTLFVNDQIQPIGSGKVVHVASQFGIVDQIQVWTEEECGEADGQMLNGPLIATVVGTGHKVPDLFEHIGSVVAAEGSLVWHVYRLPKS